MTAFMVSDQHAHERHIDHRPPNPFVRAGRSGPRRGMAGLPAVTIVVMSSILGKTAAHADHGGPHDPDIIVNPPGNLEEFCDINPLHDLCLNYGGGGGCESCGTGGDDDDDGSAGGGTPGEGTGGDSDQSNRETTASQVFGCVQSAADTLPEDWPQPTRNGRPSSFQDVELVFDALRAGQLGEARVRRNASTREITGWIIALDTKEINTKANSLGATYEQLLAETILHEYTHFLYGPNESNAERRGQEWYKEIYGHPAPTSPDFDVGLHGRGSNNPVDPCQ